VSYKSKSQRTRVLRLHSEGKITTEKLKEYEKASQGKDLPERTAPKTKPVDPNKWPKRDRWPKK
jgi:hypothetical protein